MTKFLKSYFIYAFFLGFMLACSSNDEPSPTPEPLLVNAAFTADKSSIKTGESITFTSTSNENVSTWEWTFDNGNGTNLTSSEQNPSITFSEAGTYEVSLTVSSSDDNKDTETKAGFITVVEPKKSINFDGTDDYIRFSDPSSSTVTNNQISVVAWVKTTSTSSSLAIMYKQNDDYMLQLASGGRIFFAVKVVVGGFLFSEALLSQGTGGVVNDGEWHHVVGTWDGSEVKIYIDGTLNNTKAVSNASLSANGSNFNIGSKNGTERFFPGQITQPSVWNKALTVTEVGNLYDNCSLNGDETGLVGYWDLDSDTSLITDLTSNGNDGTFRSGTTITQPTLVADVPTICE